MPKRLSFAALALVAVLSFMAMTAHHTLADERDFKFINNSNSVVVALYVSPNNVDDWQDDVLADAVVNPGESGTVRFTPNDGADTCIYDIRIDTDDGQTVIKYNIDLCQTDTITFS
jgi:hypothetical protein